LALRCSDYGMGRMLGSIAQAMVACQCNSVWVCGVAGVVWR
jgi:hypothetical protein